MGKPILGFIEKDVLDERLDKPTIKKEPQSSS